MQYYPRWLQPPGIFCQNELRIYLLIDIPMYFI